MRCPGWLTGKGGAWPWCHRCGLRADHHEDSPLAAAVKRIVDRGALIRHPSSNRFEGVS